jgi:hypothetical protein
LPRVNAHQWRQRHVGPAKVHEQFSATGAQARQIGIAGAEQFAHASRRGGSLSKLKLRTSSLSLLFGNSEIRHEAIAEQIVARLSPDLAISHPIRPALGYAGVRGHRHLGADRIGEQQRASLVTPA